MSPRAPQSLKSILSTAQAVYAGLGGPASIAGWGAHRNMIDDSGYSLGEIVLHGKVNGVVDWQNGER